MLSGDIIFCIVFEFLDMPGRGNGVFLIWVGSKNKYFDKLSKYFPPVIEGNYYEPFLGSGSVFFNLFNQRRFANKIILSDTNLWLTYTYLGVRDHFEETWYWYQIHRKNHSKEYFNRQKQTGNLKKIPEIAGNFLYINAAASGGIWREAADGIANITARNENIRWISKIDLFKSHRILSNSQNPVQIHLKSFEYILENCQPGDFVYLDPPYVSFNQFDRRSLYRANGFSMAMHRKLREVCYRLTEKKVFWLQSNSNTDFLYDWYADHPIALIPVNYKVTVQSKTGNKTDELLISNYDFGSFEIM